MTLRAYSALPRGEAALKRLGALAELDAAALEALRLAFGRAHAFERDSELLIEGQPIAGPKLMLAGWAARTRVMDDGRRQIINFTLPGDLIGHCDQREPVASTTIIALTDVQLCPAPPPRMSERLHEAYAMSRALEESYLFNQVTRLGRFNAQERIADLLLELHDRLELAGLAQDGCLTIPLTQEMLADAMGLTAVHVNRMLQQARHARTLTWKSAEVVLRDPIEIRRSVGCRPTKVSKILLGR